MSRPVLRTGDFTLWRPSAGDHAALHALTGTAETRRYLSAHAPDPAESFSGLYRNAGSWALHGYGMFVVREAATGRVIGNCGVFRSWRGLPGLNDAAEAGWVVAREWWGRGVAGQVMRSVLDWFDDTHGCQRIACMIQQGNVASERVAAGLGFLRYGEHCEPDGPVLALYERPGVRPEVDRSAAPAWVR